jgi:hypothetical protein
VPKVGAQVTLRRQHVDRCLESVDGVDVWYELIRGAEARQMVDGRLLKRVLDAKAKQGKTRPVAAPLRIVKADRKRETA